MAKSKSTPIKRPRRASQRSNIGIDLSAAALKALMTEQCRDDYAHITIYRGTRKQLLAAGVPEAAFAAAECGAEFQLETLNVCSTGSREILTGALRVVADSYELEILWGSVHPYSQASHPAIRELARMLLIDVGNWARDETRRWSEAPDLSFPLDRVATDPRSEYSHAAGAPRLQVSADFCEKLMAKAQRLYDFVLDECEVFPRAEEPAVQQAPRRIALALMRWA